MKVAVCISGLLTEHCVKNNEIMKRKFPDADFYYGSCLSEAEKFQRIFPNERGFFFEEPVIHYHPYNVRHIPNDPTYEKYFIKSKRSVRKNQERIVWSYNSTKQHLSHAHLLEKLEDNYGIIVRARFDTVISESNKVEFKKLIVDSHKNHRAHGFNTMYPKHFERIKRITHKNAPRTQFRVFDYLIIYPRDMIDPKIVFDLHKNKTLRPSEYGWHQLLRESFGNNNVNWSGWVHLEKSVPKEEISE